MMQRGTVLMIESYPEATDRLGDALEAAGYEVLACPGPSGPDYTCVGARERHCPLVERADVVVLDPRLEGDELGIGTSANALVELYEGSGRPVVVLGAIGWVEPFTGGRVMQLGDRPETREVVGAVRSATEAEGFVPRS
jgi:hypothetical protein